MICGPSGCHFAPFYGKLKPDQVYCSSTDGKLIKDRTESAVASRSIDSNTVSLAVTIEASA